MYKDDPFSKVSTYIYNVYTPFPSPCLSLSPLLVLLSLSVCLGQVMDKYLKVKKIAAPMDEVKFTWGPHTLAPELTPNDVQLEVRRHTTIYIVET